MEKKCIICKETKSVLEYYKHAQMGDGRLNKCKSCCKSQAKERQNRLSKDLSWVNKERARGRDKYHRLGYKSKQKDSIEKYPWKKNNRYKGLRKWFEAKCGELDKMIELHHWSYREEHLRDVILLTRSKHKRLHNHLEVDVDKRCYIVKDTNELLDTREKHVNFIKKARVYLVIN